LTNTKLVVNGQAVEDGALVYFAGVPFGFIRPIFQALGGKVAWQSSENQAVVTWHSNLLLIPATGKGIILNGQPRTFREAHRTVDGRLCVSLVDLADVFLGTLRHVEQELHLFLPKGLIVALDAGHGGLQPGAVGAAGTLEKELARQVVDLLAPRLRAAGAEVVDIRRGDETLSLAARVRRTRLSRAQLFISIHYNAHENRSAHGTETFHAAGNVEGADFARFVQGELVAALGLRDRGVKPAAFHVIRTQPEIPAILVEVGFLTNPTEEQFLQRHDTLHKTADALYRGICRFIASREQK